MARKGERPKGGKSPDKSPRRVGRPSRRRKKSDSESSEDKKAAESQVEQSVPVQSEAVESSTRGRKSRRQAEPSTSDSTKVQSSEWKEDESFWSSQDDNNKSQGDKEESEATTVWKVQTSNGSGSGGEIQKLRICRQRPAGAGSDSAESSMSPAKDSSSSPLHKRMLKRESQKSPLVEVENSVAEIELPPSSSEQPADTGSSCDAAATSETAATNEAQAMPQVQKVIEYVYEVQPSIVSGTKTSPPQVSDLSTSENKDSIKGNEEAPQSKEVTVEDPVNKEIQLPETNPSSLEEASHPSLPECQDKSKDEKTLEGEAGSANVGDVSATEEGAQPSKDSEKDDSGSAEAKSADNTTRPTHTSRGEQGEGLDKRRKSDCSVKSGGSGPSESNEPLLEISVFRSSPVHEEGEIVDDSGETAHQPREDTRIIRINTKKDSVTTSTDINKPGGGVATTAKKHPLITGPEPDESPAVRRRKLTALTSSTRTLITPAGTARQVRSIPGQALKAVLLPEAEKKDKEKRPRPMKAKIEEETEDLRQQPQLLPIESKVKRVDDVRQLLNSNRDRASERLNIDRGASPVRSTDSTIQTKPPSRKVSIGTAPVMEEVKAVKPARSKSPGDSKATPILFITNLVRPFTAGQLKELLARTGTIAPKGFFIDKIKSKCFVKYVDVEMAIETRHALNGVKWPVSNPKTLKVCYSSEKELKSIEDCSQGEVVNDMSSANSGWMSSEQATVKDKEKRKSSLSSTREWDRGKPKSGGDVDVIFVDEYSKDEKFSRVVMESSERVREHRTVSVREKHPIKEEPSTGRNHLDREREKRKRRSTPILQEHSSPPPPARKFKKKDYDAPAKLLDDLFRKTKTTPCLYWLPLSAEQISVKGEARKKHMAEAERRMAELKKSARLRRESDRDRRRK